MLCQMHASIMRNNMVRSVPSGCLVPLFCKASIVLPKARLAYPHAVSCPYMPTRTIHASMPRFSGPKKDDNLPQTLMDRAQNMWSNIKYLFRFYLNGVKQIWRNRTTVREIHADVRRTKRDYTWEEMQMIRTHSKDMVKLPFFVLILATVEELLPLMVIYTPFMLPSTCILPSQLTKIRQRFELKRSTAIKSLRAALPTRDVSNVSDKSAQAAVAALPSQALHELATVYNLSKWGGSIMQRGRIVSHMRILQEDDERLIKSKTFTSTEDADYKLSNACIQRGMYVCATHLLLLAVL